MEERIFGRDICKLSLHKTYKRSRGHLKTTAQIVIKQSVLFCLVSECHNKTVIATVKPGETEAVVSWSEPERTCWSYPKRDNPSTSGRFPIGIHRITYKYEYIADVPFSELEMKCHVDVIVTGMNCCIYFYWPL
jgi:hypothetical protein